MLTTATCASAKYESQPMKRVQPFETPIYKEAPSSVFNQIIFNVSFQEKGQQSVVMVSFCHLKGKGLISKSWLDLLF